MEKMMPLGMEKKKKVPGKSCNPVVETCLHPNRAKQDLDKLLHICHNRLVAKNYSTDKY
jgi:hypothetical protein